MVRIGVISDTHLNFPDDKFKRFVSKTFENVDFLLHAGDITSINVYDFLRNFNLKAVLGNMDDFELASILPKKLTFEAMGKKIGLIHGRGSPYGIEDLVLGEFSGVDLIIFGHSHVPKVEKRGDVFLFNPGSYRKPFSPPGTVGLIEIHEEKITFEHIPVT